MKNFETPEIVTLSLTQTEVTVAGSGIVPEGSRDYNGVTGCNWNVSTHWCNHNSGSHSELAITGHHTGGHSGAKYVELECLCVGFKLNTIKDKGGYNVRKISENRFIASRDIVFNNDEKFEFNIQLTASDSEYEGAVAKTNDKTTEAGKYVVVISCVER